MKFNPWSGQLCLSAERRRPLSFRTHQKPAPPFRLADKMLVRQWTPDLSNSAANMLELVAMGRQGFPGLFVPQVEQFPNFFIDFPRGRFAAVPL